MDATEREEQVETAPPAAAATISIDNPEILEFFAQHSYMEPQKFILYLIRAHEQQQKNNTNNNNGSRSANAAATAATVSINNLVAAEYRAFRCDRQELAVAVRTLAKQVTALKLPKLETWFQTAEDDHDAGGVAQTDENEEQTIINTICCDHCQQYTCQSRKSLALHKRKCLRGGGEHNVESAL